MESAGTHLSTVVDNSPVTSGVDTSPESDDAGGVLSYEEWVKKNMDTQQYVPSFMMDEEVDKIGD